MQRKVVWAVGIAVLASGCSSTPKLGGERKPLAQLRAADFRASSEYADAYDNAMTVCQKQAVMYKLGSAGAKDLSFGLAILGVMAGSVIAPALAAKAHAARSAIAGWSGVAGASTGAVYSLERNGLSPFEISQASQKFSAEISKRLDAISTEKDPSVAIARLQELTFYCSVLAPSPEAQAATAPAPAPAPAPPPAPTPAPTT